MGTFFLSNEILKASLALLPTADRSELSEQLGMASGNSADEIVRSLSRDSGNSIINALRREDAEPTSYLDLLNEHHLLDSKTVRSPPPKRLQPKETTRYPSLDEIKSEPSYVLRKLDTCPDQGYEIFDTFHDALSWKEERFLNSILTVLYQNLTPEQREQYIENLKNIVPAEQGGEKGIVLAGSALLLGNIGGFGTYIALSTLLSTLSLGLLPFGAYTSASSLLSVALGPLGWGVLATIAIKKLGAPDKVQIISNLARLALSRQNLLASNEQASHSIKLAVKNTLGLRKTNRRNELASLSNFQRMRLELKFKREEDAGELALANARKIYQSNPKVWTE